MSDTVFREVNYSLTGLVEDIRMGEIGLPELQRPFVWANTRVRDLFDSMYKGFPVGYLLFWANGAEEHTRQIGTDNKQKMARLLVIDGQQRLTSLYAILKSQAVKRVDFKEETIKIGFNPLTEEFVVADASTPRDPQFIPNISVFWADDADIFQLVDSFFERLESSNHIEVEDKKKIKSSIQKLANLKSYPFTALELSSSMNEEEVSDVFVRINSKGTPLNQADFILTLMSVFWDEGRKQMEDFSYRSRMPDPAGPSPFNHFVQPRPDELLRVGVALGFRRAALRHVYSILRGKDMETGKTTVEKREEQFGLLKEAQAYALNLQHWQDFFKVIVLAGYRTGKHISSRVGLLYTYAMFLLGKRDFNVDHRSLREIMARWFFMQSLTGRYTSSPESRMEQDMAMLRGVQDAQGFIATLEKVISETLTEDYWRINLPNSLATSAARSPALFAYYAALNLLDARVLFSQMKVAELIDPVTHGNRANLERHHLFPKGYLATIGITETRDTNQIANYALIEWADNGAISDTAPSEYAPDYIAQYDEEELEKMFHWHALPLGWQNLEFRDFIEQRRKLMGKVIQDGFRKLV